MCNTSLIRPHPNTEQQPILQIQKSEAKEILSIVCDVRTKSYRDLRRKAIKQMIMILIGYYLGYNLIDFTKEPMRYSKMALKVLSKKN